MRISDWSSDVCSSDLFDRRQRNPVVVLALRQVEQRQHGAGLAAGRILRENLGDPALALRRPGEGRRLQSGLGDNLAAHRSISPNTMSSEPMIATVSASMWPLERKSMAARKAKPGARILHL